MSEDHDEAKPAATVTDLFTAAGRHHTGKIPVAAEPEPVPQQEAFYPVRIGDLIEHDRAVMYGEVVDITGAPYRHDPLDGPCELDEGWVHVPMIMGGTIVDRRMCAPGEPADHLVAVSRRAHG